MLWTKEVFGNEVIVRKGTKTMSMTEAAELLNINYMTVHRWCHKKTAKEFDLACVNMTWIRKHNLSPLTKVFIRDGKRLCVPMLQEVIGGTKSTCWGRLKKWEEGAYDEERLFESREETKRRTTAQAVINMAKVNETKTKSTLGKIKLGPRKHIEALGNLGSWERAQLRKEEKLGKKAEFFVSGQKGHRTGHCYENVACLRGD